jgi:DNA polymerase
MPERSDSARAAIRDWLRNERRLGVPCWDVPPDAIRRVIAPLGSSTSNCPVSHVRPAPPPDRDRHVPVAAQRPEPRQSAPPAARPTGQSLSLPVEFDASGLPAFCTSDLPDDQRRDYLARLDREFVKPCRKCRLHEQGRVQTVFGVGKVRPEVVFVGEGPGADEDRVGEPFVGKAGQLLTRMIAAMTLTRDQVYIANIVKCRPPENRTPAEDEMQACSPYLYRQLAVLRPRVIVALGRPASQTLLATLTPIGKLRGVFHDFPPPTLSHLDLPGCKLMPTFHPAYLLRSPNEKARAWEDLKQVMAYLGIPIPQRGG